MTSKGRILFIDGNWILHRVYHVVKGKTSRPLEDVLPQNFLSLVLKDAVAVKATHILVAFDGHAVFRYDLYPQYKASRSEKSKAEKEEEGYQDVYVALPNIRKLFARLGITLLQHKKYEADDFWASAAVQYSAMGYDVVGSGKDKDGFQVLGKNVRMYDSSAKPEPKFMTAEKAEKMKGVPISKMIMLQTLLGDQIDDIPQVLSPAKAKAVCNKYGSVKEWFEAADAETRKFIQANQAKLVMNNRLVTLKKDLALPDPETLKPPKNRHGGQELPRYWFAHQELCYPKSKGLFGRCK
jgi:5'-3' exonuclease